MSLREGDNDSTKMMAGAEKSTTNTPVTEVMEWPTEFNITSGKDTPQRGFRDIPSRQCLALSSLSLGVMCSRVTMGRLAVMTVDHYIDNDASNITECW